MSAWPSWRSCSSVPATRGDDIFEVFNDDYARLPPACAALWLAEDMLRRSSPLRLHGVSQGCTPNRLPSRGV